MAKIDILLVDDRPDNFTVLEAVLNSPEYTLTRANSGFEATMLASRIEFAVILLDVQMPGKDGFETAKEIRQAGSSKDSPIIFVTAICNDEMYVNLGYDSGAVDYIFKPFNANILRSKVAIFADLFTKNRKLVEQTNLLRSIERRESANKLLQLRIESIEREHVLQQKYKDLVESIDHCIIWSADRNTLRFTFVSPQAERLTSYKISEWEQEDEFWTKILHPDDYKSVRYCLQKSQKGEAVEFECRLVTKDGRTLWFHTSVHLADRSEGDGVELRGLSVDITSLKQAEQILKKSEIAQRFLAEAGVCLAETTLDYDKCLAKVAQLAVPTLGSWCGVHIIELDGKIRTVALSQEEEKDSDLICRFEEGYQKILNNHQGMAVVAKTGTSEQVSWENCDPSLKALFKELGLQSYICVPMVARGRVFGTISVGLIQKRFLRAELEVIEELARRAALAIDAALLYQKAEDALQTRDEFLSIASHELRTPLTPLKLQFQMTARLISEGKFSTLTPERMKKMMDTSDRQLDRLNSLIGELLNVSRINLGRMDLDCKTMDLSHLVRNIVDQYSDQLAVSCCEVSLDLEPVIGEWDTDKLEQVIINLLTNSIKYGLGKPIHIQVANRGYGALLMVKDHGIGIDDEAQKKIFDLFERAPSAKKYGGLGLGLYVVNNIVKMHGGSIRVESKLGEETLFTLELPKNPPPHDSEVLRPPQDFGTYLN